MTRRGRGEGSVRRRGEVEKGRGEGRLRHQVTNAKLRK